MPDRPDKPEAPQSAETRRDWETFQEDVGKSQTQRLRVGGGWLIRTVWLSSGNVAMVAVDPLFFGDKVS